MKNFTKIMIGAGLTVAALGAAAAPATAATTTEASTLAMGDRVQGKLNLYASANANAGYFYGVPKSSVLGDSPKTVTSRDGNVANAAAAVYSIPAVGGGAGPLVDANGWCLTSGIKLTYSVTPELCNGSDAQLWKQDAGNRLVLVKSSWVLTSSNGGFVPYGHLVASSDAKVNIVVANMIPVAPAPIVPVDITGATTDAFSTISGTGEPGAEVVVTGDSGREVCRTTVGADGTWSCVSTIELPVGSMHLTATQAAADGSVTTEGGRRCGC